MALTKKTKRALWIGGAVVLVLAGWKWRRRIPILRRLFPVVPPAEREPITL